MNKYLVLFICFLLSLMFVLYEDNSDVRESTSYYDSVYVFNEIGDTSIVDNPDIRDINIYVYFIIAFYSLLFIIITVKNLCKINKYVDTKKF